MTIVLNLLGAIALLLWGVRMVRTGIMRAWGERVRRFIEAALTNRFKAFATGFAATLLLQSGTATALIVTAIAVSGGLAAARGLAVLLGADAGSALITAVIAQAGPTITLLSPLALLAGYVLFTAASRFRPRNVGRILIGLGLMLLALKLIVSASDPLRHNALFLQVLEAIGQAPLLAILIAALITWASYSTLAIVLLITSLLLGNALDPVAAFTLILGVNVGGGLPAASATLSQPNAARRLPLANLACRAIFALALAPLVTPIAAWMTTSLPGPVLPAVIFHIAVNFTLAAVFLPLAGPVMAAMEKLLPEPPQREQTLSGPRFLDVSALETPAVALSNADAETVRMLELLAAMVTAAVDALINDRLEQLKQIKNDDARLNVFYRAIQAYVGRIAEAELSHDHSTRALNTLLYVSNLEHAGDLIHLNLCDRIKTKTKEGLAFDDNQKRLIADYAGLIDESIALACGVMISGDVAGARRLIEQKARLRVMEQEVIDAQLLSTHDGGETHVRTTALFIDVLRELHAVNSHIISIAYPIVEAAGQLRKSRLKKKG